MNIMNALFMVVASLAAMLMLKQGFTIPQNLHNNFAILKWAGGNFYFQRRT